MPAIRKTPTRSNGGTDNGESLADLLNAEIGALWRVAPERLVNVAGTANGIIATSDTSVVSQVTTTAAPKSFWLIPIANNTGPATITIDGLSAVAIVDVDGNPLLADALVANRQHELVSDGTSLRLVGGSGGGSAVASDNFVNNGRLSPATGVYIPTAGVPGAVSLFWTIGERGNQISLYDGISAWSTIASAEVLIKATNAQTGSTHNGTRIIDGLADTSQLIAGMVISGTGVGGGAVISSVDSPTQVTASVNGTSSATNTITFKLLKNTRFDVYGKNVANALKLFYFAAASLFATPANTLQDGMAVKSSDTSLLYLGWFKTASATDGVINYDETGQNRFAIFNQFNRAARHHVEAFSATGTWYKSPCTTRITVDVAGSGGANTDGSSNGGAGGTSSFGAWASGAGGTGSLVAGTPGTDGAGSSGDTNITGAGAAGASSGGHGGRAVRALMAAALGTTEAVTVGAVGVPPTTAQAGRKGWVLAAEVLEI